MTIQAGHPELIRAKDVASILGVSISHVSNLVKEQHLVRIRIGKRSFAYDPIDVLLFSIRGVVEGRPVASGSIAKVNVKAKRQWLASFVGRIFK
jgi:predicted DNA-binding transcriptional regulator AlpA